jgi:type II secretory pathway pseudopilin PulG
MRAAGVDSGEDGFSLVETVVAFAILALVMATAVEIVGAGSVKARIDHERSAALARAQSRLAALAADTLLPVGTIEGSFEDSTGWRATISPLPARAGGMSAMPHLVRVEVRDPTGAPTTELTTILIGRSGEGS